MVNERLRISVIIAAYRPGDGIERVIRSLDAQTLPQDEFETIVVDDGSPDDTFARLQAYAAERPNMRVARIENSGWPSRPRNLGTEMASGEWVLFMDHDDSLYPDALRRCAEYAAETRADVLSPKESKTNDVWWGMAPLGDGNVPNALTDGGIDLLLPMVPHKVYRREFLLEHGLRFPEGRRMLWEDIYVNVAAWRHAEVVSVLADTPVYLWHSSTSNNSKTYGPQLAEFWDRLDDLFAFVDETLDTQPFAEARRAMLLHQYRSRVLNRFSRMLERATAEETAMALGRAMALQERYFPQEWDSLLGGFERARSLLLRQGRPDLLGLLFETDSRMAGAAHLENAEWRDGVLSLAVRAGWDDGSGGPVRFLRRGDRIVRDLPAELAAALPPEVLDVTDDVEAFDVTLGIRSRFDRVTWRLPAEPRVEFEQVDDGAVTPVARMTTQVDLAHSAMGRPLEPALWDLYAAIRWQGLSRSAAVRSELPALAALVDGRPAVGYANKRGNLSLDAKGDLRNVVKDARPGTGDVTGTVERFVVTLPHIHVRGAAELGGEVTFVPVSSRGGHAGGTKAVVPARVLADAQGARLEAGGRVPPGRYRLAFRVADGVPLESDFVASVSEDGEFDVVRQPRPVEVPSLRTRLERGWSDLTSRIRTRSAAQVAHRG